MEAETKMALLRRTKLLGPLPETTLRGLLDTSREVSLGAGETIFEEGDPGHSMYVVLAGEVAVSKGGKEIAVGLAGDYFGEMALIEQKPRSATLRALAPTTLLEISESHFRAHIASAPPALLAMVKTLSERSRNDLETLASDNLKLQRYAAQVESANRELNLIREQLEEKNRLLQRLSSLDTLTGIANRRRFDEVLDAEWKRAIRDHTPLAVVFCDIDFFKVYNDSFGHQAGDECLVRVARVLGEGANRPADLAARYGGEEFVILLVDTTLEGALFLAEKMRARIEGLRIAHPSGPGREVLTVSFGVASVQPRTGQRPAELVDLADRALYAAKQQGRNRVVAADPDSGPAPRTR